MVRVANQLHGGVVDIDMVELHIRILLGYLLDHLAPEDHAGKDIGLVHRGDLAVAQAGRCKGHPGDALDLGSFVDFGVPGTFIGTAAVPAFGLAEIDTRGQLAHHEDIKAVADNVRPERTGRGQRLEHLGRTQVAEQIKMFA